MGAKCKFNDSWPKKYNWLKGVDNDLSSAFCKLCNTAFKIDSKGESSVTRHAEGETHKSLASNTTKLLTTFFKGNKYCILLILLWCISTVLHFINSIQFGAHF